jgi:hypothetical protein
MTKHFMRRVAKSLWTAGKQNILQSLQLDGKEDCQVRSCAGGCANPYGQAAMSDALASRGRALGTSIPRPLKGYFHLGQYQGQRRQMQLLAETH